MILFIKQLRYVTRVENSQGNNGIQKMPSELCFIKSIIYEANKSKENTHNDIISFIMSQHDMYIDCVSRHTVSKPTIIETMQLNDILFP